jgi:alkylation response protein AidB-like acyl-CoA dehydrogenase
MDYHFTPEQDQFREILSRFLRDKSPADVARASLDEGHTYDADLWQQLCGDLGLAGLHIPEAYGGAGYGPVEQAIVMEEQGRALLCAPFLASAVMAGHAILQTGSEDQKQALLPGIADGSVIAALAVTEQQGNWADADIQLDASPAGGGFVLNGRKRFVVDGQVANLLVVAGRTAAGVSLFSVDAGADGVACAPLSPVDTTRKLADISFTNAQAQLLGAEGGADLNALYNAVLVAFANEMVGGAQAMLESAVAYAKMRVQFGRVIGSFQAIKHRCANLMVEVELAKAAAYQAAQILADGDDATIAASQAKAAASDVYLHAAEECIQFHGGIGFTWENDTHLWFKRAKSSEVFLGTPQEHRERLLQAMGV